MSSASGQTKKQFGEEFRYRGVMLRICAGYRDSELPPPGATGLLGAEAEGGEQGRNHNGIFRTFFWNYTEPSVPLVRLTGQARHGEIACPGHH